MRLAAFDFGQLLNESVWCAQLDAQHMAHLLRSAVRLPLQVVVLVQQLTPTAAYKWMALMMSDGGMVSADVAKLLGRLGRRGCHRDHNSHLMRAASMSAVLDMSQAPQMAVVPESRDNYHLEDPDHHHRRAPTLRGVERCVAAARTRGSPPSHLPLCTY